MKQTGLVIFLVLLIAAAFYFLGKKNGSNDVKTDIVQNTTLIKQIAELSALQVDGITTMKVSNKGDNAGLWDKFKNYFAENTLYLSIPYTAKYGVDMNNVNMNISQKDSLVIIYLPKSKLLSLQLLLDKVDAMGKTGVFNSITLEQYIGVQKQLYLECNNQLSANAKNIQLAETNIRSILQKYYEPLHLKVECKFGETAPVAK